MFLQWNNPTELLPKRAGGCENFSVDVLTYTADEGFYIGYYQYGSARWVFLDIDGDDMLEDYEDFNHSAVMWTYLPETPKTIPAHSVKIDGE